MGARHGAGGTALSRDAVGYGDPEFARYLRRAILAGAGYDAHDLARPIVGIADLSSDYNPCHASMPRLVEAVKRGVLEAGGLPLAFPTMSLGETLLSPTSMLYRNLLAMETEELITAQPMDAVVLLGGCDKTVPAQLMAAATADVPAIIEVVGPALTGTWRGATLGACTDCRRLWGEHRAGALDADEIGEVEQELYGNAGTCTVMGTASTMALIAETLGLALPGAASPPAFSGARLRHATATGRRAVQLAAAGPLPRDVLTADAFHNAVHALAAAGGSTNAIIHLLAVARRAGVALSLDDVERAASDTPRLLDLKPAGRQFMAAFHEAGGVPALLRTLSPALRLDHVGVSGVPLRDLVDTTRAPAPGSAVTSMDQPFGPAGALAVLRGTLAPQGAVIKAASASGELLVHEGPAVVFESPEDAARRLDDPSLGLTPGHVLVLRNAGPVACGMPEAGSLGIPKPLAARGVRDMVRISDGRMSGTSFGTVVLHCCPEAAVGGPLALVRDGDRIRLDVPSRRLDLLVTEHELARRTTTWQPARRPARGWRRLYAEHVLPASQGADLDFLADA